ncbi:TIGR01777 family oxidoreductase [Amycolatopsis azurea]|uniref:Cell division inhibitor n=1 Tax=Amycolatopsis azurea DSM 43854 TaxID=1238180 RepID=M2NMN9_9PSEU|nr:TIGR01777 family oxidoreductase [Amycolatopsis azurea]EMD23404.1 Cell division inhibitor [Amycolatopsis azurea DSM 43854]OOC04912.1 TIGR01777 family protein [Amycolatopsis azurea DSM 43854]
MGLTFSSVVDAELGEVFDWFSRPGAIHRLTPPWQPIRVGAEATSLRDGRAELVFPGGVTWIAAHDEAEYDPPRQFVDVFANPVLSPLLRWRHTHRFAPAGPRRTEVIDVVDTPVPAPFLRSMFAYRHRQFAADLAAQQRYRSRPLTVGVTGAGGLVGTALTAFLTTAGHRVVRLVRRPARDAEERTWDPFAPAEDLLEGLDAVVHLAGEPIAGRFTDGHRRAVRESRVGPTRVLAGLAARTTGGPGVFVSASAVGYYGTGHGDEILSETSPRGDGFLADVVEDWETATAPASEAGLRVVLVRTGLVLSPRGGLLRLQRALFGAGLGGPLGDGTQWMPWIGLDDLTDIYTRALTDETMAGPVNAVAPEPVRNADYTRVLGRILHRPALMRVPEFAPRLLLGRAGAGELALASHHARPDRLTEAGHVFRHRELAGALSHLLGTTTSTDMEQQEKTT